MSDDPDRLSKPIFHTYQQLLDDLDRLRAMDRVGVVDRAVTQIGQSPDGKWKIAAIKLGKNPAHRSFICGNDHAREWISVEVPYLLAELMVKVANDIKVHPQFDRHKTQIKQLLKDREVWIVPMLNPEGNTFTHLTGRQTWRKNHRLLEYEQYTTIQGDTLNLLAELFGVNSDQHSLELMKRKKGSGDRGISDWQELARLNAQELAQRSVSVSDPTLPLPPGMSLKIPIFGVDLNRNYPFKWRLGLEDESKHGSAFPGTEAGSEYEVQAVMKLFTQAADDKHPFQSALGYHNFAEIVLYPWGYQSKPTNKGAVADFAGYLASLINQARSPTAVADIKRAQEEFLKAEKITASDAEFLEKWSLSDKRQFYTHGNPGSFSFGGEGGSFMDWAHDKFDGMPVYNIELSPSRREGKFDVPESQILQVFRENLPAALALIEYQNFQRQARKRGSCYRCHFFSYAGPQTKGVLSQWTQHLQPVGDRETLTGEVVELFTTINPDVFPITDQVRVRFDILEQDYALTGGADDSVVSFIGTGAAPSKEGFKPQNKTTVFQRLDGGQTLQSFVEKFKQTQNAFENNILIIEEPQNDSVNRHHLLTWWTAQRVQDFANSEFYYIVNVNDAFEDQSEDILDVSSTSIPTGNTVEDKVRAAMILINEQLGTGITDWAVTDAEATRVLQILNFLEPEVLLRTVQRMRLSDTWKTFRENLPSSLVLTPPEIDLELRISPVTGYLMRDDEIEVTIIAASVGGRLPDDPPLTATVVITDRGVTLPDLPKPVPLIGVLPKDAPDVIGNAYVDQMRLRNPIVKVKVTKRGGAYAMLGTFSPIEFESSPRARDTSEQGRRQDKQELFIMYITSATGRDPFLLNALGYYHKWLKDNFNSPEFLTLEPHELFGWALQQASIPPPRPPVTPYLEISRRMLARAQESPADEKQRIMDALDWFFAWLDAHPTDAELQQHDADDIWLQAWGKAIQKDIKRIEDDVRRKVEAQRDEAELKAHFEAADKKLERTMELIVKKILPTKEPEAIDAPSQGITYLIMASENERIVRELIAEGFLHDMVERMGKPDPEFRKTTADQDLLVFLKANPDLLDALRIAYSHPYVEKHDLERDIPGWQIAVEVAVGFIPIVGQVVGVYEAIAGEDLFGNPLTGTERAIIGASILLPAAAKIYKVGRAAVTTSELARAYRLTAPEADALFRATAGLKPGSANAIRLGNAKSAILNNTKLADDEVKELGLLLKEMGMTDEATSRVLSFSRRTTRAVARRVDRLELAKFVPKLTAEELAHLQTLGEDAWSRLFSYASSRTTAFAKGGKAGNAVMYSLKGKIAEELFTVTKEFEEMREAVFRLAEKEGISRDSVQFVTNIVSDLPKGSPFPTGELTDGAFVAFQNNKARVLGVIESKSPSNLKDLATSGGEYFGQIEKDFERFTGFTVSFNGRAIQEGDVIISRQNTLWYGVAPPDLKLGPTHIERIQNGIPGFRLVNGLIPDARLNEVAERLLQLLSTP